MVSSLGGTLSSTGTPIAGTKSWFLGTGRRKESVARVFLRAGSGKFTVNGRTAEQYFPNFAWKHDAIGAAEVHEPGGPGRCGDHRERRRRRRASWRGAHGIVSSDFALQPGTATLAANQRFSDARFPYEGTQEVRAKGRAQALPVHEALVFRWCSGFCHPNLSDRGEGSPRRPNELRRTGESPSPRSWPASCRQEGCSAM